MVFTNTMTSVPEIIIQQSIDNHMLSGSSGDFSKYFLSILTEDLPAPPTDRQSMWTVLQEDLLLASSHLQAGDFSTSWPKSTQPLLYRNLLLCSLTIATTYPQQQAHQRLHLLALTQWLHSLCTHPPACSGSYDVCYSNSFRPTRT